MFGQALIAHLPGLRRYAAGLAGSMSGADDLVQDCIERALKSQNRPQQQETLGAWLRTILRHGFIDERRKLATRGHRIDLEEVQDSVAASHAPSGQEDINDFVRATMTLSFEHRQILMLAGVEELSYREIAQELAIPMGTVMSRLARARGQLRLALGDAP